MSALEDELMKRRESFLSVLPAGVNRERFLSVATSICRDPNLRECTPASILSSIYRIAKLGLDPDVLLREAYVVPRRQKGVNGKVACFQAGYAGLMKLARNTRQIAEIQPEVVFEGEVFSVRLGTERAIIHEPYYSLGIEPGKVRLAYTTWTDLLSGRRMFHICTAARLNRARSAAQSDNVWTTDEIPMVKKTAIIDASKSWPMSAELAEAVNSDEAADRGEGLPELPAMRPTPQLPMENGNTRSELDDFTDAGSGEMTDDERAAILAQEAET